MRVVSLSRVASSSAERTVGMLERAGGRTSPSSSSSWWWPPWSRGGREEEWKLRGKEERDGGGRPGMGREERDRRTGWGMRGCMKRRGVGGDGVWWERWWAGERWRLRLGWCSARVAVLVAAALWAQRHRRHRRSAPGCMRIIPRSAAAAHAEVWEWEWAWGQGWWSWVMHTAMVFVCCCKWCVWSSMPPYVSLGRDSHSTEHMDHTAQRTIYVHDDRSHCPS